MAQEQLKGFWKRAHQYPPFVVRLLARKRNGPWYTGDEIADRCSLTSYEVSVISVQTSWDDIPLGKMREFLKGCGLDFTDVRCMNRVQTYLTTKNRFHYLKSNETFRKIYAPLLAKLGVKTK